MDKLFIVAKKELKGILKTRSQMLVGIFFALWFSVMTAPVVKTVEESALADQFNNLLFYFVLMLGIFMAYLFSGRFSSTRKEKVL